MTGYLLIGVGFAFAAAAQPGPLQAFLLSRVAAVGWRRTLPAALAPLVSDGPIAVLAILVLSRVQAGVVEVVLKTAGGIVLLWFAFASFRQWRQLEESDQQSTASAPRTFLEAVVVNLLNPGPYIGWSLVLGPLAIEAWRHTPAQAIILVAAFYLTIVTCLALFILLLGTTAFLGPRGRRALLLAAALALAALGTYQIISLSF